MLRQVSSCFHSYFSNTYMNSKLTVYVVVDVGADAVVYVERVSSTL